MESASREILIVEDDPKLAHMVARFLKEEGFEVGQEDRGDRAVDRILAEQPAAVLLDLRLPGLDGMGVCRAVRPHYSGAILMMTARGDEVDEVLGLELGADDYLAKPVRPRVLLAHLRAVLRRAGQRRGPRVLRFGALRVDPARREVWMGARLVELSTAEFDLLLLLARSAGRAVSRETLYEQLQGCPYDGLDRSIDLRVSRLRRKLEDDADRPRWIKSVRGVGYLLAPP